MSAATATTTAAAPANGAATSTIHRPPPLWSIPIEVLGLTGDFASGKTLFALSIAPGKSTLIYDTEKSAKPYASLGFDRIDLPTEMLKSHPGGYKPIDLFTLWWKDVKAIRPGKYRVICLDTVSEIESGLVAYVRENPTQFGYTAAQFARGTALVWGAVKDFWKAILTDLASRCETFVFTSHLRREFAGDRPTSTKTPKGKETLMELASLYLWLDRTPDKKGNVPATPSATVVKSRLSSMVVLPNGLMDIRPSLPPRLPIATPSAVRNYLDNPPDYDKLKADERVREAEISEAEMESMRLSRAEAERDAESLRLERFRSAANAANAGNPTTAATPQRPAQPAPPQPQSAPQPIPEPSTNGKAGGHANGHANGHAAVPVATTKPVNRIIDLDAPGPRQEQLDAIVMYRGKLHDLGMPDGRWAAALAKRGVQSARELTPDAADEFIAALAKVVAQLTEAGQQQQAQTAATAAVGASPN